MHWMISRLITVENTSSSRREQEGLKRLERYWETESDNTESGMTESGMTESGKTESCKTETGKTESG
jgi:hypothetical protein